MQKLITPDKEWYKSKTIWAGGAIICYAVYKFINHEPIKEEDISILLGLFGLSLIGIRGALGKIIANV